MKKTMSLMFLVVALFIGCATCPVHRENIQWKHAAIIAARHGIDPPPRPTRNYHRYFDAMKLEHNGRTYYFKFFGAIAPRQVPVHTIITGNNWVRSELPARGTVYNRALWHAIQFTHRSLNAQEGSYILVTLTPITRNEFNRLRRGVYIRRNSIAFESFIIYFENGFAITDSNNYGFFRIR